MAPTMKLHPNARCTSIPAELPAELHSNTQHAVRGVPPFQRRPVVSRCSRWRVRHRCREAGLRHTCRRTAHSSLSSMSRCTAAHNTRLSLTSIKLEGYCLGRLCPSKLPWLLLHGNGSRNPLWKGLCTAILISSPPLTLPAFSHGA
jgi:hypothetical protein